ncbi:hypothetical protein EIP91_008077 [Steccherinum ochraceum]|uniref:Hydrophobin n=1 Tax=Steccherinum ochraceum TaxID=92696 RepID=A0A4R0RLA3_9APHY|nr:hypothetical protein EIP91_008077 [Steccherinum ochraceum]
MQLTHLVTLLSLSLVAVASPWGAPPPPPPPPANPTVTVTVTQPGGGSQPTPPAGGGSGGSYPPSGGSGGGSGSGGQCNTNSSPYCCNKTGSKDDIGASSGILGGILSGVLGEGLLGSGCSPLLSITDPCSAKSVCCSSEEKDSNNLIGIGCIPIIL